MQKPLLSIIIVNYNVKDFLYQALNSVGKALYHIPAEIFVVDNASRDNSTTMIRENFPKVQLIENKQNLGFSKANNQAIAQTRGQFIVLINPDTIVQEDTFQVLLHFFDRHPDAGIVGCKILNSDGTLQLACRRSIPTPWVAFTKLVGLSSLFPKSRWFGRYNLTYLDPDQTTPVEAISGSFMMVRRAIIDQVGMLDERFFMYGEDLDWCYRVRQAGWQIFYVPDTKIVHYKGASTEKARLDSIRIFYRAMLQFARKHFRGRYLFFPQWFLMIGIGIRAGISFLYNGYTRLKWPSVDLIFLNLSLLLALVLRFGSLVHWQSYVKVAIIYSTVWILSFYFVDLYNLRKFSISRAAIGVTLGLIINSTITYFAQNFAFSRLVVLYASGFNYILILGWRYFLQKLTQTLSWPSLDRIKKRYFRKEAILVGDSDAVTVLYQKLNQQVDRDTDVVAALLTDSDAVEPNGFAGIPLLTNMDNLPWYIEEYDANAVIFSSDSMPYERLLALISESGKYSVDFKIASKKMEVIIGSSSVDYIGDISLVDIDYRLNQAPYRLTKRIVDLFVAMLVLIVTIPLWPIMFALGYRLVRVPVFYPGSDYPEKDYKTDKKPTAFIFCKNNRSPKSFFERFPLFFRVLQGNVTLVGSEMRFQPFDTSHSVSPIQLKPGLVHFVASDAKTKAEHRTQEMYYLKNYSPLFDLEILCKALFKR